MEISFSELRSKIVINLIDGRKLGHVIDLIFEQNSAKVLGVIVPGSRSGFSIFRPKEDIFIPYHSICKIGEDTILVQLTPNIPQIQQTYYKQTKEYPYLTASGDIKQKAPELK